MGDSRAPDSAGQRNLIPVDSISSMNHTPGPWEYKPISDDFGGEIKSVHGNVARVWWIHHEWGTPVPSRANGALIAAAPELLAALKVLADCSPCQNGCDPKDMTCASNLARAAIAKAEKEA